MVVRYKPHQMKIHKPYNFTNENITSSRSHSDKYVKRIPLNCENTVPTLLLSSRNCHYIYHQLTLLGMIKHMRHVLHKITGNIADYIDMIEIQILHCSVVVYIAMRIYKTFIINLMNEFIIFPLLFMITLFE